MADGRFFDIAGREVFDVGTWNGFEYSDQDLDEMVANFEALKAMGYAFPIKISHDPQQRLISNSELPAAGYIARLYRSGSKLVADLTHVPARVKELIDLGAYATVSAEIYPKVQLMGRAWNNVLSAVAFLGGEIPAVGTLDDALALYARAQPWPSDQQHVIATYTPARPARKEEGMTQQRSFGVLIREVVKRIAPRKHDLGEDTSLEQRRQAIEAALETTWSPSWTYVVEMFDGYVIACRDGDYFQVPYTVAENGTVALTVDAITAVESTWRPASTEEPATTNNAGTTGKEDDMAISKAILTALGLPETADEPAVLKAIAEGKGGKPRSYAPETQADCEDQGGTWDAETSSCKMPNVAKLAADVRTLQAENAQMRAEKVVEAAIRAHKLAPSKKQWATTFATKDPSGFAEWVKDAPEIFKAANGSEGDAPETGSAATRINELVVTAMKADATLDFKAALGKVTRENPELAREYVESARRPASATA